MQIDLSQKRALVTGSSSGIGKAIALAMGKAGAKVAVNYRSNPDTANEVVKEIKDSGSDAIAVQADVSDLEAVHSMFQQIDEQWNGIDILVNNAGIDGKRAETWEIEPEDWKKVIEVNLYGTFHCSREALKRMVPQKSGVILNISSVHEVIAWTGHGAYTASKAAQTMLGKSIAQEVAPYGIRVLSIAPGAIKTPINEDVWGDPEERKDLEKKTGMGRIGETEEIAQMAVVLASDAGSYVTGTTVFIDGGMTNYPDFAKGG